MRIGLIGAGKMAEAIIASLIKSGMVRAGDLAASDVSAERRRHIRRRYGVRVTADNREVARHAAALFLAVKPQQFDEVLTDLAPVMGRRHLVISIAAGRTVRSIESRLPGARVARVMPNLATLVGEGMSVFCLGARAKAADRRRVARLLACFGKVLELPERQFHAVTALSGSGPGFLAYLVDRLADAGVKEGLKREHALLLAEQTLLGTARLFLEKGMQPAELAASVASAKGTTAAGLAVLAQSDLATILSQTLRAAAQRSRELSR